MKMNEVIKDLKPYLDNTSDSVQEVSDYLVNVYEYYHDYISVELQVAIENELRQIHQCYTENYEWVEREITIPAKTVIHKTLERL